MAGPMISENWADLLEPGIREWVGLGMNRRPQMRSQMFDVITSQKAKETFKSYGAIAPEAFKNYEKTGQVSVVGFDEGYEKEFIHKEYPLEFVVQRKLIEDAQYQNVIDGATALGDSYALFLETEAASVFNNAVSSSYLGGDGVALGSASHPLKPGSSAVQSNTGTLALSLANVDTVRRAMMAYTDDVGNIMAIVPDTLVVPPSLEATALEIANSIMKPDTANNTINVQYGRFKVEVNHYLTQDYWFMVDSFKRKQDLKWIDRVPFGVQRKVQDETLYSTFIAYSRFSYGWKDWRWVYVSNPS